MKIGKKTIIITTIFVVLITVWYFWNQNKEAKIEEENEAKMIYSVENGDIKTEVKVVANAKLANEQNLSFGQEGKITKVYVKVGDEIKAGKILAELSMDDYQNAIQTSELELENARLGLTKLLNNDTSLRESQIISQINETKSNYNVEIEQEKILKEQLETKVKQQKDLLEQLIRDYKIGKKNLEIVKSGLSINTQIETEQTENTLITRKQTINSIINSLNSSLGDIEFIVESIDKIYGVSDDFKDENDSYENFLGVKDRNLKKLTESKITKVYNLINIYTKEFENINLEMSDAEIYNLIQNYYNDSVILIELCDTALDSIDMSIISEGSLDSITITGFKSTINTSRISSISLRSGLENLSTSINSLLSDSSQKDQLSLSIEEKQLNYERQETLLKKQEEDLMLLSKEIGNLENENINTLNRKKTQNNSLLETISVLEKELEDLLDGADKYDIKQQNNRIRQAELRLASTRDQKDNYQIIAEFDGRVRTIDIVEGEQYKLDDRNFIVIENPNLIELELQINQIDIVKIKKGNSVIVTFDSYPNNPIEATVSARNVNPEANGRGGFYYKSTIILEKQELEILAGMSAIVKILTNEANNVLLIPSLALVQEGEKQFVYIKKGDKYEKHEIKTGIINNFQAEVKEGLEIGDAIRSSVLDEEALKEMGIDDGSANPFGE